jgi:hypothetical protein
MPLVSKAADDHRSRLFNHTSCDAILLSFIAIIHLSIAQLSGLCNTFEQERQQINFRQKKNKLFRQTEYIW